jgi:hypothetical protein
MIPWRLQDYIYPSYESADVSKVTADPPVRFVVGRFFLPRMAHRSGMFLFYASHDPLRTSQMFEEERSLVNGRVHFRDVSKCAHNAPY